MNKMMMLLQNLLDQQVLEHPRVCAWSPACYVLMLCRQPPASGAC